MGLAPYGEPKYSKLIMDNVVDVKEDGSLRLYLSYFGYCTGLRLTNEEFDALFEAEEVGGDAGVDAVGEPLVALAQGLDHGGGVDAGAGLEGV